MRVMVTGACGKVGGHVLPALVAAGHDVRGIDVCEPDPADPLAACCEVGDLTDPNVAARAVADVDAVVHLAAVLHHRAPAHEVFATNTTVAYNVIDAAIEAGVCRLVYLSSETVPGYPFAPRSFLPPYVPVDEDVPVRPQDAYSLSKWVGERLCAAAAERSDLAAVSLRSSWVQGPEDYAATIGPVVRDPSILSANLWSYTDVRDLAAAVVLAVEADLPGHEIMYVAQPDNAAGRPLADLVETYLDDPPPLRATDRTDAAGISSARAQRLLGWAPRWSWRDHLDDHGKPLSPDTQESAP